MIVENAKQVWRIYQRYGRGSISWSEGIAQLVALGVPSAVAGRVLAGTYPIAGH